MIPFYASKFFRLPISLAKDNLIVNTSRSSVSSMEFHSHKLHESWTLKQPHSFSCPVVYVPHKNELVCVKDKNVILVWSYEADSLNGAKELKFQDTIFAVIPVEHLQLVVFNSGSCLLLETAHSKSEFKMKPYFKNENLLWADASLQESKVFIFLLTLCKAEVRLHFLLLNMDDGQTEKLSEQVISRDSLSLQSWCLGFKDEQASFITMWSDGQVHSQNTYSKTSEHLWTVPGIQDKELLALEAIDSDHIVVVRFHPSCGCSYEIWDVQYATRKTQKSIDLAVPENLQVRVLDNTLFIPSSHGIVAEALEVTPSTLAAVVGKKKSETPDEMQDVVFTWTSDGMLLPVDTELSNSDISNNKFSNITENKIFQEFLSELHGQNADKVCSYLSKITFMSESNLVKLLQYLLREHHPTFSEKSSKRKPSSKESRKSAAKIFLALFRISYDEIYLQQNLRKLTYEETMATIGILRMLLKKPFCSTRVFSSPILSSTARLLTWLCLLSYAHGAEIVADISASSAGEKTMLVFEDLHKVLMKKVKESINCEDLLEPKKIDFENSTTSLYCIEVLHL